MATVRLLSDTEIDADPRVKAVFDDIRATRGTEHVNNIWRALAHDPAHLESTWQHVKQVMATPSALDPLTKELVYIAVSTTAGCSYCVHSHTAAARAKGMTEAQHADLLAVIGVATRTAALATSLGVPVDERYDDHAH